MIRFNRHLKGSLAAIGAVTLLAASSALADTRSSKSDIARNLDIFGSIYKELQTLYVDSIDAEKSINTAIAAMLDDIDPYTVYYPPTDNDELELMTSGEYGGIGATIFEPKKGKGVYVSDPQEGTPSAEAGMRPGDRIIMIDGDSVTALNSTQISAKLRGEPGTDLKVTVVRPYATDSVITFDLHRRKIRRPAIPYYGVLRDSIGYIYLTQYTDKAAADVKAALLELKRNPAVKSIVLDLRDNGGGLLEAAVQIVGYFVPKQTEVLRTRGKDPLNEKIYKTTAKPLDEDIKLFVLTNGNTASASEITAGALQDLDRAVIVGTRSFGKGLVQTTRPLPYEGVLKVTTGKYYIPSGRLIQAVDYSHRNPDGTVARTPDSLTHEFRTKGDRPVRDGGGITPDITVEYPSVNRLTYNIYADNWAFDYATRYRAAHDSIASAEEFVVTDEMFDDFKSGIDPEKFNYDRVCETMLKNLREAANIEGYMTDSVRTQFDVLEGMLRHNLNHDLDHNRKEIKELLAQELQKRYYYQRGYLIETLKSDPAIDSVVNILSTSGRYNAILHPAK